MSRTWKIVLVLPIGILITFMIGLAYEVLTQSLFMSGLFTALAIIIILCIKNKVKAGITAAIIGVILTVLVYSLTKNLYPPYYFANFMVTSSLFIQTVYFGLVIGFIPDETAGQQKKCTLPPASCVLSY